MSEVLQSERSNILFCLSVKLPRDQDVIIATYQRLIRSMPRANQYLLLYVLDLLSVFARHADKNLMTASSMPFIQGRPFKVS